MRGLPGFLLANTGPERVRSTHGMITTVGYQIEGQRTVYALEGSIAITGSLVQWLRDGLNLIRYPAEVETLAVTVPDNGGCYVVPAFAGLYSPHWRSEARGIIAGLTSYISRGHIAPAVLEATAWQTREVLEAMQADTGTTLPVLRVDGGMTANNLLMQLLADINAVPVERQLVAETVSLGAAYGAGIATGFWPTVHNLPKNTTPAGRWAPSLKETERERQHRRWRRAVESAIMWDAED